MKQGTSTRLARCTAAAILACAAWGAHGATTAYTVKADFLSDTGATSATGALPLDEGPLNARVVGSITFNRSGVSQLHFGTTNVSYPGGWSSFMPGHDMAISNVESFDIVSSAPVYAMGFDAHEPGVGGSGTDTCGVVVCTDSSFTISVLNGATLLGTHNINFADDTAAFFGVRSTVAFDRLEVREIGAIDDEYFGQVYTSANPIPEPSTYALMLAGLGLVGFMARHRKPGTDCAFSPG